MGGKFCVVVSATVRALLVYLSWERHIHLHAKLNPNVWQTSQFGNIVTRLVRVEMFAQIHSAHDSSKISYMS